MVLVTVDQAIELESTMQLYPGRAVVTTPPPFSVRLHAPTATNVRLTAAGPSLTATTMDGIPEITIPQYTHVTLTALVKSAKNIPLLQSDVQGVMAAIFAPTEYGGTPLGQWQPATSEVIYDTLQYDLDPDGYNVEVNYLMSDARLPKGVTSYLLEAILELATGGSFALQGRVQIRPTYLLPINIY